MDGRVKPGHDLVGAWASYAGKARNAAYPGSLQALRFGTMPDNCFAVSGMPFPG